MYKSMDLGIFCSSSRKIILWAVGPIILIASLYFSTFFYFRSVNSYLEESKDHLELIPIMRQKLEMAKQLLNHYKMESRMDSIEALNAQLNQMGQDANFTINSLIVKRRPQSSLDSGISTFKITIKGEGNLSSIVKFFNKTYTPESLFTLESSVLNAANQENMNYYKANFEFFYYTIPIIEESY